MPIVTRSRRSTAVKESFSVGLTVTRRRRRSERRSKAAFVVYADESDTETESEQSEVMERDDREVSDRPEEDDQVPQETSATGLKTCTVVLDRLRPREEAQRKELEDKEEMSRKTEKQPVSRIPTFQSALSKKRPTGPSSHSTELPPAPSLAKKDAPSHAVHLPEKEVSGGVEGSKVRLPGIRETALPLPTVRVPKLVLDFPSGVTEDATLPTHGASVSLPKSSSLSEKPAPQYPLTVSARPSIKASHGDLLSEKETEVTKDDHTTPLLNETPPSQTPPSSTLEEDENQSGDFLADSGDDVRPETRETVEEDMDDSRQTKAIVDEEPPWETESLKDELEAEQEEEEEEEDEESLSGASCQAEVVAEEPDAEGESGPEPGDSEDVVDQECFPIIEEPSKSSEEPSKSIEEPSKSVEELSKTVEEPSKTVEELPKSIEKQSTRSSAPAPSAVPHRPIKVNSSQSAKKSGCSSFVVFCLFPTLMLLVGGVGQHIWHYGLPMSVAQLMAQMELHWLEGLGFVQEPCSSDCRVHLVESIPQGLYQSPATPLPSISDSWLRLLGNANSSVNIAAYYFTLRSSDLALSEPSDSQGQNVFKELMKLQAKGVNLQIAVNSPQSSAKDTTELASTGAEVREVDLNSVTGGIVHTKLWVVDQKHLYVGSANMDWRSLSQVKEVGISVEDCSCLAQDASRIFRVYWSIGAEKNGSLPPYWPARFSALSGAQHPLRLKLNGVPADVYLSSSPPQISARGRSDDLTTILSVISDAQKFVHISVMDYLPLSQFTEPLRYWPAIDSALRAAACTRGVEVSLLISCWDHSPDNMFIFLQSLLVLSRPPLRCNINIKVFAVPSTPEQMKIPFARVNHAKYMVTDRVVYIGTSNWSQNYFTQTAGVGLVVNQTGAEVGSGQRTLLSQVQELFHRDWTSDYAKTLSLDAVDVCPRHHRG